MWKWFSRDRDNEWTKTDRRERWKTVGFVLGLIAFVGLGVGLLVFALANH